MSKRKKTSPEQIAKVWSETSDPSATKLRVAAGIGLIILAVAIVYFPSLSGGFILDDDLLLTNNQLIKAPDGLYRFWCTTQSPDYWPVSNSTLWFEWRLWGMNTTGYHVTNLILHIVAALLIWLILRKLSIPGAFLAAMIFAVHPVNVESVAWIAQRKNLTAMLFFLLSILCYLKMEIPSPAPQNGMYRIASPPAPRHHDSGRSPLWYWLSLLAFVLAMLSKGSVAVLPVLLLGIIWWRRKMTKRDLVRTAPFFVVALALAGVNLWFQTHGTGEEYRAATFAQRLLGAGGVVWFYLYKALLPLNLAFVYPQWHVEADNLLWWLPLFAALVFTAVLWWYRNTWSRPFLFAWGFFCVSLVPVLGFTDVGFMRYSLVADRYQHIALIGVIALWAATWSVWHERTREAAYGVTNALAIVVIGTLIFLSWQQASLFRDAITLYGATLKINPDSSLAQYNLGNALDQAGRPQEAIEHYRQAMRLEPDYVETYNNLGVALDKTGRSPEAIEHFRQALSLKSDHFRAYNNLGVALCKLGRPREAIEHFQQALKFEPNYAEAHFNLGNALVEVGRSREAVKSYEQALRLKPDYAEAHNNLAATLNDIGQYSQAIEHSQQALRLKPDYARAYSNLASIYAKTNRPVEALEAAQKALNIARSKGQTALAKQIEDWLNSHLSSLSGPPSAAPSRESTHPLP